MRTALIYGSVRHQRKGIRAAKNLSHALEERGHECSFIDPLEEQYQLPLLDRMYKEYEAGEAPENMERIAGILDAADGFIVVTAEYNHSVPPALKNLLDHFQGEYQNKPSGIACYSAGGFGGVRASVHLRVILAELGTPSIPSILPLPKVQENFEADGTALDERHGKRSERFLEEYEWYLRAMKREREKGSSS